jgi:hypothetical protein
MKTKTIILLLSSVLFFSTACTTLKRYNSVISSGTDTTLAGIDLFGFSLTRSKPESSSKSLWDLSADAQSQFIKILNSRFPDNDKFLEALSFEYLKGDEDLMPTDYVSKDLRLIFSVSKNRNYTKNRNMSGIKLSPADRIEYLNISLEIPENSNLRFTGWNMFTTEYGTVDIADVSFNRILELESFPSLATDINEAGIEVMAGGKRTVSRKEEQALKYRYLKINGRINDKVIEMEEEGTRETDLTGNITADVSLVFERLPEMLTGIYGLFDSTGRFNEPENLLLQYYGVLVPKMEDVIDTIYADLKMDYLFRNVVHGKKTFPEWDDHIKYYHGSINKRVKLFTANDYVPDFSCVGFKGEPDKKDIIKLESSDKKIYSLIFRTYDEASVFYKWLMQYCNQTDNKDKVIMIGGQILKFLDNDLTGRLIESYSRFSVMPYYIN